MPYGDTTITTPTTSSVVTPNTCSFESFLQGWHHHQAQLLTEITAAVSADDEGGDDKVAKELVARALLHFEEYYVHKSLAAQNNVFSLFSQTWRCSLESPFMWITGFRPGVLLQLVSDSVHNLTTTQIQAIQLLKRETRIKENGIAHDLTKIQEKAAAYPIIHGLRNMRWSTDNQPLTPTTNDPLDELQMGFEEVVANADTLRLTTAANVAAILIPTQGLRFLVAAFRLQQGMRMLQIKTNNYVSRDGY